MRMARKRILFIGGSLNQTMQMHRIAAHLSDHDCLFTPMYCTGGWEKLRRLGLLDFTIIGGQNREKTDAYFAANGLEVDYGGWRHLREYDLFVICTDLLLPGNLDPKKTILVQEGMTDPENFAFHAVTWMNRRSVPIPLWLASTSTTGLTDAYLKFCVASEGYRRLFERKGVRPEKLVTTGIPNFDDCDSFLDNDFPHKGYVLAATTDTRENFKWDNRKRFIRRAVGIAQGRRLIFKLHPNENHRRSTREINLYAPEALVYSGGNTNHMIANCDTLITQYSSVVYVGLALGKTIHSYFELESLKELVPVQNGGLSGRNIAGVCREFL